MMKELPVETQHVSIKNHGKIHVDFIRQIAYIEKNCSIITCSRDRNVSLANKHFTNRRKAYIFKIHRVKIHEATNTYCIALIEFY